MSDPFLIEGPALISLSGGRTSADMLRRILDRGLQSDVHVLFCNTGKEDDRTLDFVHEIGRHWSVGVRWLQYRRRYLPQYRSAEVAETARKIREAFGLTFAEKPVKAEPVVKLAMESLDIEEPAPVDDPGFVEVTYETAARTGDKPSAEHPFTNLVCMSGVPNATTRLCTTEMKIRVMKKFMLAQGYEAWTNVVGIRADEPRRVARMRVKPPERWENAVPLADAGVTVHDVLAYWRTAPFDLQLVNDPELGTYEGNCDQCMLKSDDKKVRLARERPESLDFWEKVEEASGSTFRPRMPYREVRRLAMLNAVPACDVETDLGDCICHD